MTTAPQIRLKRHLTPVQFQQLCVRLHERYPGWQPPGAWVQVAYNGNTILIHPRRDLRLSG